MASDFVPKAPLSWALGCGLQSQGCPLVAAVAAGRGCDVLCALFRWGSFSQFLETCPASPWLLCPGKAPSEPRVAAKRPGCMWQGVGTPSVGCALGGGDVGEVTGPMAQDLEAWEERFVCYSKDHKTQFPHIHGAFVDFNEVLLL